MARRRRRRRAGTRRGRSPSRGSGPSRQPTTARSCRHRRRTAPRGVDVQEAERSPGGGQHRSEGWPAAPRTPTAPWPAGSGGARHRGRRRWVGTRGRHRGGSPCRSPVVEDEAGRRRDRRPRSRPWPTVAGADDPHPDSDRRGPEISSDRRDRCDGCGQAVTPPGRPRARCHRPSMLPHPSHRGTSSGAGRTVPRRSGGAARRPQARWAATVDACTRHGHRPAVPRPRGTGGARG